jgi:Acetylglutamate kinase
MQIIKIGGSLLFEQQQSVALALANRRKKMLVIIGYGPRLRALGRLHGIPERRLQKMSGGAVRVTDDVTAAASYFASSIEMNRLLEALQAQNVRCSGVYGSQGFIWGERPARARYWDEGVLKSFDGDFSGRITKIATDAIEKELEEVECLVISPMLRDTLSGRLLICDADYAAVEIANALGAESLTIVTDVPGFKVDGEVVHGVAAEEIDQHIETATGGMKKKLAFIKSGLQRKLRKVVVGDATLLSDDAPQSLGTTFQ